MSSFHFYVNCDLRHTNLRGVTRRARTNKPFKRLNHTGKVTIQEYGTVNVVGGSRKGEFRLDRGLSAMGHRSKLVDDG